MDSNFFIEPFQVLWNSIPGFWNSGRCGTALLRAAAAELTPSCAHSFTRLQTETPRCEFRNREQYFNADFFSRPCLNRRRYCSLATLFGPRARGLLQTGSSSWECQSIMRLVQESAHTTTTTGLLLASHGKFMYSVWTWLCCWKWTMFNVCLVLVGWFMNYWNYLLRLVLFLHECTMFSSANYVGLLFIHSSCERRLFNSAKINVDLLTFAFVVF